jgi:type I restriction enzyme R subunit
MCIAVSKEAGYEYVNADELREAKNDVIVEL